MVRHRNRTCYMLHTLRGLYDTYPSALGFDVPRTDALVNAVLDEIDAHPDTFALDALFDKLFALERHQHLCDPSLFAFPGPLIRKIVRHMDRCAFLQPGTQRYFAISQTVAARADYFPPGARVQVVPALQPGAVAARGRPAARVHRQPVGCAQAHGPAGARVRTGPKRPAAVHCGDRAAAGRAAGVGRPGTRASTCWATFRTSRWRSTMPTASSCRT